MHAPDQDVAALHPGHTAASVRALLPRLHYFEEGTCIVHHLFGAEVTELVRAAYGDAYLTAHFEVPLPQLLPSASICVLSYVLCRMLWCFFCVKLLH